MHQRQASEPPAGQGHTVARLHSQRDTGGLALPGPLAGRPHRQSEPAEGAVMPHVCVGRAGQVTRRAIARSAGSFMGRENQQYGRVIQTRVPPPGSPVERSRFSRRTAQSISKSTEQIKLRRIAATLTPAGGTLRQRCRDRIPGRPSCYAERNHTICFAHVAYQFQAQFAEARRPAWQASRCAPGRARSPNRVSRRAGGLGTVAQRTPAAGASGCASSSRSAPASTSTTARHWPPPASAWPAPRAPTPRPSPNMPSRSSSPSPAACRKRATTSGANLARHAERHHPARRRNGAARPCSSSASGASAAASRASPTPSTCT